MKARADLLYFLSETHYFSKDYSILNVTLVGSLSQKNLESFRTCGDEILKSTAKCMIFNFRDVAPELDRTFSETLSKLFQIIREKPALLRLSGVHPDLKQLLLDRGIAKEDEVVNNLATALQSIIPEDKKRAA